MNSHKALGTSFLPPSWRDTHDMVRRAYPTIRIRSGGEQCCTWVRGPIRV